MLRQDYIILPEHFGDSRHGHLTDAAIDEKFLHCWCLRFLKLDLRSANIKNGTAAYAAVTVRTFLQAV